FIFFCFSRISLAPRSTLFPYTTLFRSDLLDQGSLDLVQGPGLAEPHGDGKWLRPLEVAGVAEVNVGLTVEFARFEVSPFVKGHLDRKSTRLNSSHLGISYAVFCLKKKK